MPIFADIIYLDRNENEFELVNEFIFKFPKNGKEFKGYNLRMNSKNQLEFDSNDSVYKIPRQHLKNGDKIIINDLNGNTQEFAIIGREFRKVKEEDFKNSSAFLATPQFPPLALTYYLSFFWIGWCVELKVMKLPLAPDAIT